MKKVLLYAVFVLAILNVAMYATSCQKENSPVRPFGDDAQDLSLSAVEIADSDVIEMPVEERAGETCPGTLQVEPIPCGGCGSSDFKFVIEVLQRCSNSDAWTVTQTIPCSAINYGTFPITIQHERKLGFRMAFKNLTCWNHPNWSLLAKVTIKNASGVTLLTKSGQNGPSTWDISAGTTGNVFCSNIIADSCLN